jgi:hypothetical protein
VIKCSSFSFFYVQEKSVWENEVYRCSISSTFHKFLLAISSFKIIFWLLLYVLFMGFETGVDVVLSLMRFIDGWAITSNIFHVLFNDSWPTKLNN